MTTPIAVTGATGHLGGQIARLLSAAGVPLRLVVRNPARAPELPDAEVARATYADADAVRAALAGVDVAFMVSAGESAARREDRKRGNRTWAVPG